MFDESDSAVLDAIARIISAARQHGLKASLRGAPFRARSSSVVALTCARMIVFGSGDMLGVELCGALKNTVAIAAGMADELAVGDNGKALLMTRGMAEPMRLAAALGADTPTLAGLAGVGDLHRHALAQPPRRRGAGSAKLSGTEAGLPCWHNACSGNRVSGKEPVELTS